MSALNISEILPTDYPVYFVDSNVLLAYFKNQRASNIPSEDVKKQIEPRREYIDYLIWFTDLIEAHNKPIDDKNTSIKHHRPKIILTSLLATEIVNAYSRNISWELFKYEFKDDSSKTKELTNYKRYRGTTHYKKELNMLIDDITALRDYCLTQNDDFNNLDFFDTISEFTNKHDFNDFFYMHSCNQRSCPIITHDGDFENPHTLVLTKSKKMLLKENKKTFAKR